MPDATPRAAPGVLAQTPTETEAQLAAARFCALSNEVRGCALMGPSDALLAASNSSQSPESTDGWIAGGAELLAAADAAASMTTGAAVPATHAHVATEEGEVYALRQGDLAMVAVTDRFTLSSLVLADMRSALRDLARESAARRSGQAIAPATPSRAA